MDGKKYERKTKDPLVDLISKAFIHWKSGNEIVRKDYDKYVCGLIRYLDKNKQEKYYDYWEELKEKIKKPVIGNSKEVESAH